MLHEQFSLLPLYTFHNGQSYILGHLYSDDGSDASTTCSYAQSAVSVLDPLAPVRPEDDPGYLSGPDSDEESPVEDPDDVLLEASQPLLKEPNPGEQSD